MAPRRILFWTETYQAGGSDRYVVDLVHGLDPERHAWRWAGNPCAALDGYLEERLPEALPRHTIPIASLHDPAIARIARRLRAGAPPAPAEAGATAASPPADPGLANQAGAAVLRTQQMAVNVVRLRRLIRASRPDVVHINNGGYPGAESCRALSLAAAAEGVASVVHFVHNMAYAPNVPASLELALDRRVDGAVGGWATAAHRASDRLAAVRDIARDRIGTIHYGIPLPQRPVPATELGFAPGALNVACVAAFEPRKGHLVLLDALAAVREQGVDVRVVLIGVGSELEPVRRRAAELALGDGVRFLEWRADVDAVLAAADALVLPSLSNECLPYAILEAMGLGLPVIGTDVAGIPEEIDHGTTGIVVAPGDAPALARAIAELAGSPETCAAMGEAGRKRLTEVFGPRRMVDQTVALWDQAGRRKTPSM